MSFGLTVFLFMLVLPAIVTAIASACYIAQDRRIDIHHGQITARMAPKTNLEVVVSEYMARDAFDPTSTLTFLFATDELKDPFDVRSPMIDYGAMSDKQLLAHSIARPPLVNPMLEILQNVDVAMASLQEAKRKTQASAAEMHKHAMLREEIHQLKRDIEIQQGGHL